MKRIAIIIGSKTDLRQCLKGLKLLKENEDKIQVLAIHVSSQHRHTLHTQGLLSEYSF